mmetsp:Transcript_12762/g.37996  ORF Transcript_12762/g.37996 Transcript_12762/m.37996 type:complete len:206 (+) Transcript_12762:228-845(+)
MISQKAGSAEQSMGNSSSVSRTLTDVPHSRSLWSSDAYLASPSARVGAPRPRSSGARGRLSTRVEESSSKPAASTQPWYVSQGCAPFTSAASPQRSSKTSMSSSSSSSISFQYCTMRSSSVQRRMTTHTGRSCRGRSAALRSPSVASPSEAMTTHALVPEARSSAARARICCVTAPIWAHRGVRPVGCEYTSFSMARSSWALWGS